MFKVNNTDQNDVSDVVLVSSLLTKDISHFFSSVVIADIEQI